MQSPPFVKLASILTLTLALAAPAPAEARSTRHHVRHVAHGHGHAHRHHRGHHRARRHLLPVSANAPNAELVFDADSGRILHVLNPDQQVRPASLTKMMTLYLTFRAVQQGWLNLDDRFMVSENAAAAPPTRLGLRAGNLVSVDDLIRGAVTESANDAARTLGENLDLRFGPKLRDMLRADLVAAQADEAADDAIDPPSPADAADWTQSVAYMTNLADSVMADGSEADFARLMTLQARLLGMDNTTFRNASGLPDPEQLTTAPDMAMLAYAIVKLPPSYYQYFSVQHFNYGGADHHNHNNRFLTEYDGADGIKTGYTELSGFNVVDSARHGDTRLIAIVMGSRSHADRETNVRALLNAGFEHDRVYAQADAPTPTDAVAVGGAMDFPTLQHNAVQTAAAGGSVGGTVVQTLSTPGSAELVTTGR